MEILTHASARRLSQVRMVGSGINEIVHINDALERADDLGLDLVLINETTTPPVVKIQDFKKIEYEKKKARKSNKGTSSLKELQFKVNISDHDLQTKIKKIEEFLSRGDKVKISVRLKGRERENPERAHTLIERIGASVPTCRMSKIPGPVALAILEPVRPSKQSSAAASSEDAKSAE